MNILDRLNPGVRNELLEQFKRWAEAQGDHNFNSDDQARTVASDNLENVLKGSTHVSHSFYSPRAGKNVVKHLAIITNGQKITTIADAVKALTASYREAVDSPISAQQLYGAIRRVDRSRGVFFPQPT
jgi:hypothetical protein